MAFLEINPANQAFLNAWGLTDPHRLLALPGPIVSGHPDRHVARVTLGSGAEAIRAFLKREHRVPWKQRFISAWHGAGFRSQSYREYRLLQKVRATGLPGPQPLAAGEDNEGRAFLLVREIAGTVELRRYLREHLADCVRARRRLLRRLGEELARIHEGGFSHPDLYAKHILVDRRTGGFWFLDWQRARHYSCLGWRRRWGDLAALDATLADELATDRERLVCLGAYLKTSAQVGIPRAFLEEARRRIRDQAISLQRRRRIREQRQPSLAAGSQELVWIRGEALCLTGEFHEELQGQIPEWLEGENSPPPPARGVHKEWVPLPGPRQACLVRRQKRRPLCGLWSWLRGRPLTSPELEQAAVLFRLQRFGVGTPRLLAFGQKQRRLGQMESFVLTEPPEDAVPLKKWLNSSLGSAKLQERRTLLREAGRLCRQVHEAGYALGALRDEDYLVRQAGTAGSRSLLFLGSVERIRGQGKARVAPRQEDLAALQKQFAPEVKYRTEQLQFLLGYLDLPRLAPAAKQLIRSLPRPAGFLPVLREVNSGHEHRHVL